MPQFKRRHFLQLAGSTLASIGLSQTDFLRQSEQYGKVLAQSTPRKLALLIGINEYNQPVNDLYGCVNDVELQRQLLIHRFGFNPTDIMTLTTDTPERLPTRENIIQAFKEFLIGQARPGDVVVFHYSGHGSLILDPNPIKPGPEYRQNGTLVPQDATALNEQGNQIQVPDIMGRS
ncbi:MAG: caspase family protein, partial [Cyanobacteria bacterium J06642_11]